MTGKRGLNVGFTSQRYGGPPVYQTLLLEPGRYQLGDLVGFGGLQEAYDDQLRGTSGVTVSVPGKPNEADKILFQHPPVDGKPLKTTIDIRTQNAITLGGGCAFYAPDADRVAPSVANAGVASARSALQTSATSPFRVRSP